MIRGTTAIYGIYTLTQLHVGTGQATGAVDLPIAREQYTGFPIIPATAIKGVLRDILEKQDDTKKINDFLGPNSDEQEDIHAGGLIFTEAQTIAIPFRSINTPFFFVTCPLLLERLDRNIRTFGLEKLISIGDYLKVFKDDTNKAYVSNKEFDSQTLVIEDMVFSSSNISFKKEIRGLLNDLKKLLPTEEENTERYFSEHFVIIPNNDFSSLVSRALPVNARIKLTGGKTASDWINPETGKKEKGNLWYEEVVPSDSLFSFFVMNRPGIEPNKDLVQEFERFLTEKNIDISTIQIGGNETVGYGWCWLTGLFS